MEIEKVYYKHYRYCSDWSYKLIQKAGPLPYSRGFTTWNPSVKGGLTECHLVLSNETEIVGIAECSTKDNFCYATGRKIAYGRAMKQYEQYLKDFQDYNKTMAIVWSV